MASSDRAQRATRLYRAFADGDREFVERPLADEFAFSSPARRRTLRASATAQNS